MNNTGLIKQYPLIKYTLLLLFAFLFFQGLFLARQFLIPFSLAALMAMLMLPVCKKLEKWKFNRGIAIGFCILIILLILAGLVFLFSLQIASFAQDIPSLQGQMNKKLNNVQHFVEDKFGVSPEKQIDYLEQQASTFLESTGRYMSGFVSTTTGMLATIGIIVIYIFFFMYYRNKFQRFFLMITPAERHETVGRITKQISQVTQQYLTGVLTVVVILAIMNSIGLLIIGIKQAIFFGVLAGILNIIPYIGVLIGSLFPIVVALLTKDGFGAAIAVACVFAFNQFLENNFLTPNIVGGKVKVNPLATIIALLIGGYLWGVAGMILFIPFLGIAKIIFDNIESLQPYGYLIGEEDSPGSDEPMINKLKRKLNKKNPGTIRN
jgi:predicted PurR-regulated permease PerM